MTRAKEAKAAAEREAATAALQMKRMESLSRINQAERAADEAEACVRVTAQLGGAFADARTSFLHAHSLNHSPACLPPPRTWR